ncbi:MAG: HEAT repeat domain-containing protein [Humidesulfovibrio sp.]|uniref:HEAT repeat domain-containing protein n=1 Tax=Humidesulfovibrio sp. TaxID=2910988 RepID=UPI0027EAF178|nr:HEAT repeat domain-containing protein [Humidesulfovibrio sp.]MDQ7835455.1 HEAT repeat domain-containing protein [Humidesulfovibrio sp.]
MSKILGGREQMTDCKEILSMLTSPESDVLREGAYLAGEAHCEDAVPLLVEMLKSSNIGVQEAADNALRMIGGKEAVSGVIPLLQSDEAPVRNGAMDILRALGGKELQLLIPLLKDEDVDLRIFASDILGSAENVMAVAPLCEALLKDPEVNVRYQAAVSLGSLGMPEAAKCLNQAMRDEEWVQYSVIEALAKIGHASSVDAMVKAMSHSSELVVSMIIDALGEMGNVKAVTLLLNRMESSPTALRNKIVKSIVNILGAKLVNLLPKAERENFREYLLVALEDEEIEVQDAAILGLAAMGGDDAAAGIFRIASKLDPDKDQDRLERILGSLSRMGLTEILRTNLQGGDQAKALLAVEALSRVNDPEVETCLVSAFWENQVAVQRSIIFVLARIAGPEAIDFFMDILARHHDGKVLRSAANFLGQKLRHAPAADALFAMLDHQYDDVKEAALDACVAIDGPEMQHRFQQLYQGIDPLKRLMSVYALGKMDASGNIDILKSALEDESPEIRKHALEAVASLCHDSEVWLELLVTRLLDENRDVRQTVVEIMGQCFSAAAIPHLLHALHDDDDWVKVRALEVLGQHKVVDAIPEVVELLEHPNKLVTIRTIECLGSIGGTSAFRALLAVSGSEDYEIMEAAEAAIAKIQDDQEREI